MIGHSYSADGLASEFLRIMNDSKNASQEIEKHASAKEDVSNDSADSSSDVNAADFLVSDASDSNFDESNYELESKINDLSSSSYASDPIKADARASSLLNGLGKIAKKLSDKGEIFASDMVHATADSIRKDLIKEASKKHVVVSELKKIASDLRSDGNSFASDLVLATVEKIKKK